MADGLLGSVLPYVYSRADALKRAFGDLSSNPLDFIKQKLGHANDQARFINELTTKSTQGDEQATKQLLALLASGYNPAGVFIGKGSKTWNTQLADKFIELEKKGLDAFDIWKQTGTFRSPDGQLRQEIPDNLMRLRTTFSAAGPNKANNYVSGIEGPIGGMVEHSQLYQAYPDLLTNTRYTVAKQPEWFPESTASAQYSKTFGGKEKISTNTKTEEEALNKLVHELQHAIQTREKWQAGGLETQFKDQPGLSAFQQYQRLAGEAEARAAQARQTMTPEQRVNVFPLTNYDVPIESLIFRDPFNSSLR